MPKKSDFYPKWFEGDIPAGTYRSILKWGGNNHQYKHPNHGLYRLMKKVFHMTDDDFKTPKKTGFEKVSYHQPVRLTKDQAAVFEFMVGKENILSDEYSRLEVAYGKTMIDLMRLREGIVDQVPDLVLHPRNAEDVKKIVEYCNSQGVALYVYGGGSSVTRGEECTTGRASVTLDTRVHMNKVLDFNETDQTITVEPGISGPALEAALNNARKIFGAKRAYTCGHFPQSFEYSCVGGWVVTRGAGQNSTYFGKIEDMVLAQEYVTPVGTVKTPVYPAAATGPDIDQIMMGSEGTFGVLTSVTLRIFRYMPENQRRFSYLFKSWEDARNAAREIMQGQFGYPSVFRFSDPEETDVAFVSYGLDGSIGGKVLEAFGYRKNKRCLMLGFTDGEKRFTKTLRKNIHRVCKGYGGFSTTGAVTRSWEHSRFTDPYMREDLQDYGLMTDTLECSVTWDTMLRVHEGVRAFCKSRPDTICMTHISHCYPQGANLYFIFIAKIDRIEDYVAYQTGILDAIQKNGASMSHHHGIGKMTAPWLEGQIGKNQMELLRALKRHFDPNNIMNPGGTLGLDLPDVKKRFAD